MKFLSIKTGTLFFIFITLTLFNKNLFAVTFLFQLEDICFQEDLNKAIHKLKGLGLESRTFDPHESFMHLLHKVCPLCDYKHCKKVTNTQLSPHFINEFCNGNVKNTQNMIKNIFKKIKEIKENSQKKSSCCSILSCFCTPDNDEKPFAKNNLFILYLPDKEIECLIIVAEILFNKDYSTVKNKIFLNKPILEIIKKLKTHGHKIYVISESSSLWLEYYRKNCSELVENVDAILSTSSDDALTEKDDNKKNENKLIEDDQKKMKRFFSVEKINKDDITFIHGEDLSKETFTGLLNVNDITITTKDMSNMNINYIDKLTNELAHLKISLD